jgi:APA family basic amino acid/polyamine antiporter
VESRADLPRKLGLFDATVIVIGTIVRSAIFVLPSSVAQSLPSIPMTSRCALGLGNDGHAEFGAMMPATGGQYVFLSESHGPLGDFFADGRSS